MRLLAGPQHLLAARFFLNSNGLAFGFITYAALKLFTGKAKEVHWMTWLIAAVFLFKFIYMGGG